MNSHTAAAGPPLRQEEQTTEKPAGSIFQRVRREVRRRTPWHNEPSKGTAATMRYSVYEGALTTVFLNWTSGAILAGYMLYLGGSPFQLAMIGSVPMLAQASAPLAAWLLGQIGHPKMLTIVLALIGRSVWLVPALMPLLPIPPAQRPTLLIAIMAVSFLFQSACGTIWSDWMAHEIPEEKRGRYFGFRGGLLSIVGLSASLTAGITLDHVTAPWNYIIVLTIAVCMAFGGIRLYALHHVPENYKPRRVGFREIVATPLKDQNFRRFLGFLTYWQASVLLAAAFVYPYFLEHLKLPFSQIAIYQAIAAITTLILSAKWGRAADHVGNKSVLAISTFLAGSLLPLCWIIARPGDPTMIFISGVIDGIVWSAIGPAIFNLSLATAPNDMRPSYLGVLSLFSGIAGFLGGLLSAPLLQLFRHFEFMIGEFEWTGYHWLFFISAMFRMQAWRLIRPVQETRAWRTRDVLRAARQLRFAGFFWR